MTNEMKQQIKKILTEKERQYEIKDGEFFVTFRKYKDSPLRTYKLRIETKAGYEKADEEEYLSWVFTRVINDTEYYFFGTENDLRRNKSTNSMSSQHFNNNWQPGYRCF